MSWTKSGAAAVSGTAQARNSTNRALLFGEILLEELDHLAIRLHIGFTFSILADLMDHAFDSQLIHLLLEVESEARVVNAGVEIGRREGFHRDVVEHEHGRIVGG